MVALRAFLLVSLVFIGVAAQAVRRASQPGRLDWAEWSDLEQRLARRARRVAELVPGSSVSDAPLAALARAPRAAPDLDIRARQKGAYVAHRAKSVVELQQFRTTSSLEVVDAVGRTSRVTLVNLNPTINAWYVLTVEPDAGPSLNYHLVNARPADQDLALDPAVPGELSIVDIRGRVGCDVWSPATTARIEQARATLTPQLSLCDGAVTVRLATRGNRTVRELAADFLRDNVWGGETLTVLVRSTVYQDAHLEQAEEATTDGAVAADTCQDGPLPARVDPARSELALSHPELGISVVARSGMMLAGRWYSAENADGVFVSAMLPGLVDPEILRADRDVAGLLDDVESKALVYLVGFDLDRFDLGYAVGTDHPRAGWSDRVLEAMRDPELPGPDGIDTIAPLIATGIIPTDLAERSVAAFTGGFKRDHGAFRTAALAHRNAGSHYGFIESGTVLSKLQPGLSTLFVLDDGLVEMKQWQRTDDALLERVAFARQNGLPVVERDPVRDVAVPGSLVSRWSDGNWSGSQDGRLRTVRGGACITERDGHRFLVYAYFSSASPSAMARVFQAYDCQHAMLLDMNALEHAYLALYSASDTSLRIEHLVRGMSVLDQPVGNATLPRFLGFADNRDLFYLVRKSRPSSVVATAPEATQ